MVCQEVFVLYVVANGCDIATGYVDNSDFSVYRGNNKIQPSYIHVSRECENMNYITQEFVEERILTLVSDDVICQSPFCFNKHS